MLDLTHLAGAAPATGVQKALATIADVLPTGAARIVQQIDRLKGETPTKGIVAPVGLAASDALQAAKDGLSRFLHGIGTSGR